MGAGERGKRGAGERGERGAGELTEGGVGVLAEVGHGEAHAEVRVHVHVCAPRRAGGREAHARRGGGRRPSGRGAARREGLGARDAWTAWMAWTEGRGRVGVEMPKADWICPG